MIHGLRALESEVMEIPQAQKILKLIIFVLWEMCQIYLNEKNYVQMFCFEF